MTWAGKPWKAPAKSLVLYCPDGRWRFAIYNDAGILDGAMDDLPAQTKPEVAQAALVARVQSDTGMTYVAEWSCDKPLWWSATLLPEGAGTGQ